MRTVFTCILGFLTLATNTAAQVDIPIGYVSRGGTYAFIR
jgi:hypothetical protein